MAEFLGNYFVHLRCLRGLADGRIRWTAFFDVQDCIPWFNADVSLAVWGEPLEESRSKIEGDIWWGVMVG